MLRIAIAAVLVLLAAGCGVQREEHDYFPLVRGARRFMRLDTKEVVDGETTHTSGVRPVSIVHGERDVPGVGKVWVVETPRDSGTGQFAYYRKDKDGVTQIVPLKDRKPTEIRYLSFPLYKGKKWFDTERQRETFEVVAVETLELEGGTFPDCYKVAVLSTEVDWAMHQWFAPDVGPVKWESRAAWEKDGKRNEVYRKAELILYQVPSDAAWDEQGKGPKQPAGK
jgi:hypothetical protein